MGVNVAGACSCGCLTQHRTAATLQTRRKMEEYSASWKHICSQRNLVHSKLKLLLLQIVSFESFSYYSLEMGNGYHEGQVRALYRPQNETKSCTLPGIWGEIGAEKWDLRTLKRSRKSNPWQQNVQKELLWKSLLKQDWNFSLTDKAETFLLMCSHNHILNTCNSSWQKMSCWWFLETFFCRRINLCRYLSNGTRAWTYLLWDGNSSCCLIPTLTALLVLQVVVWMPGLFCCFYCSSTQAF